MKNKLIFFTAFNILFISNVIGQDMYPLIIKKEGKYGYIDLKGNLIIPNKYSDAYEFIDGLACVKVGEHWRLINKDGGYVTNSKYEKVIYPHDNGIALFQNTDTLIYVNRNGEEIFKEKGEKEFISSRVWSEGYHAIKVDGKWGIIDTTGKIIIPAKYDVIGDVHEGLLYVNILPEGDFYTYENKEGKIYKTTNFDSLSNLDPCYNPIMRNDIGWIINLKNEKVIKLPKGYNFFGYHEGWASFTQENGLETYIDKQGNLFGKDFSRTEEFNNGIARVAIKLNPTNLEYNIEVTDTIIDKCTGKEIYFVDNQNKEGKLNYIDRNGKLLNNELYDGAYIFVGEVAVVEKNKKFGAINRNGKYIIPLIYEKLTPINDKVYGYQSKKLWGLIDINGKLLTPPEFEEINFSGLYIAVKKNNKWGIIDNNGIMLIEPKFDYILYINEKLRLVGYIEGSIKADSKIWKISSDFFQENTKLKLGYTTLQNELIWKPTN